MTPGLYWYHFKAALLNFLTTKKNSVTTTAKRSNTGQHKIIGIITMYLNITGFTFLKIMCIYNSPTNTCNRVLRPTFILGYNFIIY
jgi:hypothetical protein